MTVKEFLRPRFCGSRFDGAAIPLEVLQDLAVLEEMLIEVAKWRFLEEHQGRKRSPRGFARGIELKLTAVEDGSAVPVISLVESPGAGTDIVELLQSARERIVDAIAAAGQGQDVFQHLPNKCLAYFDRFGRSLREGEAIELSTPERPAPARLTPATRRRLAEASTIRELTEEVCLRGAVPESDQDRMSFTFQLIGGQKVPCPMPEQHVDVILEAFNGYREGARVLVQGIGQYSRQRTLQRLATVEHVSLLDPLDVPARIEELRSLEAGWIEGKGHVPSPEQLDWFCQAFDQGFSDDLSLPYVYPTPEGGLQLEWSLGAVEVTIEVDLSEQRGAWHQLDTETDEEHAEALLLATADGWRRLDELLRGLAGEEA